MYARLKLDWIGKTVFLIGGGPSLTGFDFERLRGKGIIVAINDAVRFAPFADVAFTIDTVWIDKRVAVLEAFAGEIVAAVPKDYQCPIARARLLRRVNAVKISMRGDSLSTGGNSGYAALMMALIRGAVRVYLLGYDMTGAGHFHGGYRWRSRFGAQQYPLWAKRFGTLAALAQLTGAEVLNCNRNSAITAFPFANLEETIS